MKKSILLASFLAYTCGLVSAQKPGEKPVADPPAAAPAPAKSSSGGMDLYSITADADDFSTFTKAVKAAGLEETLKGKGPLTVFAPTNEAFAAIPKQTLENLMKPENQKQLAEILKYHISEGKIMQADTKASQVLMLDGNRSTITVGKGLTMIDEAKVVRMDVVATNGVIHVIDKVIMPKKE